MRLNTLKRAKGAKKAAKRVGRGIGCGNGKTAGRGHKGQRARAGGFHRIGFEGGQTTLQRRLPKFGFISLTAASVAEVCLNELEKVADNEITLQSLKTANLVGKNIRAAKVILSGKINKPITIKGLLITKGAQKAIEAAGGKIIEAQDAR